MPSQISEQIHRPKNITRKDIACFANAQQKPKLYSTNHSIAKDQNQMEMENKRKRSFNDSQHHACGPCPVRLIKQSISLDNGADLGNMVHFHS
ncbi:unnamed protein product [Aureobasidium pullulans]|nr:unnamed protein product [Aureobasidium pullulans]